MANPDKLYAEWCSCTPKNADFDDVRSMAIHYLGEENVRDRSGGSHVLIIDGPLMRLAVQCRDAGWNQLAWIQGGTLSISKHSGNKVKEIYVSRLLKLIAFKNDIQKAQKP